MDNDVKYGRKQASDPVQQKFAEQAWGDGYLDAAVGREKYALRGHRFGNGPGVEGY